MELTLMLITHQILFQGMFVAKNIILKNRIQIQIRGWNKEAVISIGYFVVFILTSIIISLPVVKMGNVNLLPEPVAYTLALLLLNINMVISLFSLLHMRDSWRVGVIDEQETELITAGIYSITRNPYFVSYNIMFVSYALLLQNVILVILALIGFSLVHWMIMKEEAYLREIHGDQYENYCSKVSRYILF